jgi:Family of unknown function (DUF6526)
VPEAQNYANHRKFVPAFHFVTVGILVINLIWSLFRLIKPFSAEPFFDRLLAAAVAAALCLLAWYLRLFPLRAQDRIIRLEESLRLAKLLPPDLLPRIDELRTGQLIALRFASDEEAPELIRAVLDGKLAGQDEIKQAIRHWRADHLRM